jgi:hypothetical protein
LTRKGFGLPVDVPYGIDLAFSVMECLRHSQEALGLPLFLILTSKSHSNAGPLEGRLFFDRQTISSIIKKVHPVRRMDPTLKEPLILQGKMALQ